ncbi:sodium:proton antiporter NhaD [Parendozoicomonas sp. Alg238-R29]|uniref:sodium:proton antiporter NhaD n=1 Tax=Parendozoicomonas sp. Alg238-R29 TaxID=2993446 RepID=UPI00248D8135|nr:sodium:proton antiporter NhaD [Parendozoicomonas sp. Alg238-R29]
MKDSAISSLKTFMHPIKTKKIFNTRSINIMAMLMVMFPGLAIASTGESSELSSHGLAIGCLIVFTVAYLAVIFEEQLHLRKSKPMLLAAGIIWVMISILAGQQGIDKTTIEEAVMYDLEEYAALLLFLLVAMTYVNALEERGVFQTLRVWLVAQGFSYRALFWVTGVLAFFISPIADNLTTALVMGAVIMSVGKDQPKFVVPALVNVVVAANAGGAFSPFGDITTLMVWQAGKVDFFGFFSLFLPSVVNFILPALLMSPFIPNEHPAPITGKVRMRTGAKGMCFLFLITITLAVTFEQVFHLPPFLGMVTGLSLLMFYTWILKLRTGGYISDHREAHIRKYGHLDTFEKVSHAEWDTLFFFFGVMFAVGGLSYLGYLQMLSEGMYGNVGPFITNVAAGLMSAVIDNIPVMFAILDMSPEMNEFQWLLITLAAGVGGSLLSVGSAAGVALMGVSKGNYTFMTHLRWSWAVLIGYFASIATHWLING